MIVAILSDPYLRTAVLRAAHPEEDVVWERELVMKATELGSPRLLLHHTDEAWGRWLVGVHPSVPVVTLTRAVLRNWEAERRRDGTLTPRIDYLTARMSELVSRVASEVTWVDRTLGDLSLACGARLPDTLRTFARRVMEFPAHYDDLHPLAAACGTTRGALKARFRRRGLSSPSVYLRWFRVLASAYLLSDRSVSIAEAAYRMGYTSDGNFCRAVHSLTGFTPTQMRTVRGWNRLLVTFAWEHLGAERLRAWERLGSLFPRVA